jgi:hypothetical protein
MLPRGRSTDFDAVTIRRTHSFTGATHGPATAVVTSLTPTTETGVAVGVANIVIHDLNVSRAGDAEEGWICEITGGTGHFATVSGHMEAFGSAAGGGDLRGKYGGRLTFP